MSCEFATLDAAYVLGSLAPAERAEYERHLTTCDACARSVRELAGMPGLLARVPVDVLEQPAEGATEPMPASLLPGLVSAAQRQQRRRTTRVALLAAAAVAVIAGGSAAAVASLAGDGIPEAAPIVVGSTAPPQQLTPVGHGSSTGWVSLTPVAWGTRLDLTCEYDNPYGTTEAWTYTLVIRTVDGRVEQVATWKAIPGKELHVTGSTATGPEAIASVEVRSSDGEAVLRLRQ